MTLFAAALILANPAGKPDFSHLSGEAKTEAFVEWAWQDAAEQAANQAAKAKEDDKADARHKKDLEGDAELGKKYSAEADKEYKLSKDEEANKRLQRIGAEIAAIANQKKVETLWGDPRLNKFEYTFKLVEGKDVNAFSLPGGYIYFFEGLLKYAESDDEIAGVMAHEVAHASLRHVWALQREQSRISAIQIPLIIAAILAGGAEGAGSALTLGGLVGTALTSGWSVKAEKAADFAGFQYMEDSKYNPVGMLTFMERLARDERSAPSVDWGIYRTHPPGRERAESLHDYLRKAGVPIRRSAVTTTFRTQVVPGENDTVDLTFGKRKLVSLSGKDALERADAAAKKLNAFFDAEPELFEVQVSADGTVTGKRNTLFKLTPADAAASKSSIDQLKTQTLTNIRTAIYGLSFRIWNRI